MWNEIVLTVAPDRTDAVTELLNTLDISGLYVEDYSDLFDNVYVQRTNLVEKELSDKVGGDARIHVYTEKKADDFAASIARLLEKNAISFDLQSGAVPDVNWSESWKAFYKPIKPGEKLVVVPEWEDYRPTPGEIVLKMEPGAAFGTGTHESTILCLRALEGILRGGEAVLDVGTGSGILGIAALLLGADHAVCTDIDAQSVKTARENAALNGVADRFTAECGDLLAGVQGTYDVVTANIVADVVIELLGVVTPLLRRDTVLILSGIIKEREMDVQDAIVQNGFRILYVDTMKEWVCIVISQA